MMKKTKYLLGIAGCALAAGSLCAANYNETFESASSWTGGDLFTTNYTYTGITGLPLPTASHTNVLLIAGDATCTPTGGTFEGTPMVDLMVQAALPDDALEDPEGEAHIAVAVDTNGIFNVFCKNRSDVAGWYPLSSTAYADGAWARVSLLFDYEHGRCQVRLDGQPMMTSNGYLNETTTDTTKDGSWYKLVVTGTTSSTVVSNLKVIGCTAVDDVVIAENKTTYTYATNDAETNGVSCAWLDKYGLDWDTTKSYDDSGMTVAQKYYACLEPTDEQKFELKSMSTTDSSVTVGIPRTVATAGRKVVLKYATNAGFTEGTGEQPVTAGETTVTINQVPAPGKVLYFRLVATDAE